MKHKETTPGKEELIASAAKPEKVLLHMAPSEGSWAGKATCYNRDEEYQFKDLEQLVAWLGSKRWRCCWRYLNTKRRWI
jgi:hypothetical protein